MRRVLPLVLALAACGQNVTPPNVNVTTNPAKVVTLGAELAAAISCPTTTVTFTIQESTAAGFVSPRDGAITTTGDYTAPSCGSVYVGGTEHVVASGCGLTATATVSIQQEVVQNVGITSAIEFPGTASACLCSNPLACPPVPIGLANAIQFYSSVVMSCGETVTSPTLPSPLPATCP